MLRLKKKILKVGSLFAITGITTISLTSCGSPLNFKSSIQMIVSDNSSTLADQSFSESNYNGIKNFFIKNKSKFNGIVNTPPNASDKSVRENNGIWKKPGDDTLTRIAAYKYSFQDGANIVVASGYNNQEALQQVTSDNPYYKEFKNSFRNSAFVFVDGAMSKGSGTDAGDYAKFDSNPYNVSSISYRADDGSFLAGISTAIFLNKYQNYFEKTKEGTLGVSSFVGLALPSTLNYLNGFRLGIHYWNTIMQPLIKTIDGKTSTLQVSWVSPTDSYDITNFVSGSFSANDTTASTLTENMAKNKASAIFPIAGPQTSLVVNRIVSKGFKAIVLGVDIAQEDTTSLKVNLPEGSNIGSGRIVQFSSIKNLADSTQSVLEAITSGKNGEDAKGNDVNGYYGLGWNNVGTLTNAGVGVSPDGLQYLLNPNWNEWKKDETNKVDNYTSLSLNDLLDYNHADALNSSDPVIQQYSNLLSGKFNTSTGVTSDSTSSLNAKNSEAIELIKKNLTANDAINGVYNDKINSEGIWSIVNYANGKPNNFISLKLSKFLPSIKNKNADVTYSVASSEAKYVGKTNSPTIDQTTLSNVFFKKT